MNVLRFALAAGLAIAPLAPSVPALAQAPQAQSAAPVGGANPTAPIPAADSDLARSYLLGPGDVITVTVYRAADYSGQFEIGEDGTVAIGTIGKVKIAGLTPPQAGGEIARRLRDGGVFRDPTVNVMVQNYRSRTVSVLGNVTKPGEYPLERGSIRTSEMLARAGATLGLGGGTIQLISRDRAQRTISAADVLSGRSDPTLSPQDTLIVNEAPNFYISGEVTKPGSYPLEPGLTVGRAIALAGGLTPRGSRNSVKVTRQENGGDRVIKLKSDGEVRPKDLIVVGSRIF